MGGFVAKHSREKHETESESGSEVCTVADERGRKGDEEEEEEGKGYQSAVDLEEIENEAPNQQTKQNLEMQEKIRREEEEEKEKEIKQAEEGENRSHASDVKCSVTGGVHGTEAEAFPHIKGKEEENSAADEKSSKQVEGVTGKEDKAELLQDYVYDDGTTTAEYYYAQGYYAAQEQYYQVMQHQLTESYSSNQEAPVLGDEMSDLHERPLGEEMSTTVQSIGNMETESNELSAACPTEMPALKTSGMVNETCSTSPALPERLKKKCVSFDERDSVCLYDPGAKSTPFAEGDLFNEFIKGNVSVSPREENLSPISPFQSDEMLMQEQHTEAAQPIIDSLDSLDTLTLSTVMPLGAPRGNRLASSTSGPQKQLKNFLKRRDGTEKMTETGTMSLDVPNIEPLGSLGEQKESLFCRRDGRYPKHNVATNILMLKPGSVHDRAEKLSEKQNGKTTHHTDIRGLDTQSNLDFLEIALK